MSLIKPGVSHVEYWRKRPPIVSRWKTDLLEKDRILDAGCGIGGVIERLVGKGFREVYGIDINGHAVKVCKTKRLKVGVASVTHLPFKDNYFNSLFCNHVIEHLDVGNQQRAMKEFYRVLSKEGKLVVFCPSIFSIPMFYTEYTHIRPHSHFSLAELAKDCGFSKVKSYYGGWLHRFRKPLLVSLSWRVPFLKPQEVTLEATK